VPSGLRVAPSGGGLGIGLYDSGVIDPSPPPGTQAEAPVDDVAGASHDGISGSVADAIDPSGAPGKVPASPTTPAPSSAIVCPYLSVPGASWRATRPLREHRCTAISPIDMPSMETQRGVCLSAAYATCPRFEAALEARRDRWMGSPDSLSAFEARVARRVPRVAPVALDRPSAIVGPLSLLGGSRRLARVALAAAMVGAAGLLLAARFAGGAPIGASPEPTVSAVAASPSGALAPFASPTLPATSTPSPSPATSVPSRAPGPTARPTTTRRYTVKSGDTLRSIAKRFGTTVAILRKLNGIASGSRIRTGQVLLVP
jgi:hypothetical protein